MTDYDRGLEDGLDLAALILQAYRPLDAGQSADLQGILHEESLRLRVQRLRRRFPVGGNPYAPQLPGESPVVTVR